MLALFLTVATGAASASASWSASGTASVVAVTGTLSPPLDVTVPSTAMSDVPVSWTAASVGVGSSGYYVTRHPVDLGDPVDPGDPADPGVAVCASSPASPITTTACTDAAVPDGSYHYVVTAVHTSWTATSAPSEPVTVVNASALVVTTQPTDTLEDEPISPAPTVALVTAAGDPFPSAGVPVTLTIGSNPAGGALAGTTTVDTDASGLASFVGLAIDASGAGYSLSATSPGLTPASSDPFTVIEPFLGAARSFSVLAGSVISGGMTALSGDLGVSPGTTVTGFPPGTLGGDIHAGDPAAADAQLALTEAYDELLARAPDAAVSGDLGGLTLTPGTYHATAALLLTGTLIFDARGDPDAVFVVRTDAELSTAAGSVVELVDGAQASNVFWVVAAAAGTGEDSVFAGTILALGAITLGDAATLTGRALSRSPVTLSASVVTGVAPAATRAAELGRAGPP